MLQLQEAEKNLSEIKNKVNNGDKKKEQESAAI